MIDGASGASELYRESRCACHGFEKSGARARQAARSDDQMFWQVRKGLLRLCRVILTTVSLGGEMKTGESLTAPARVRFETVWY